MMTHYSIFIAVDYFNAQIIFTAKSSGELSQKIILAIEKGSLPVDGAVRMYRTSPEAYEIIQHMMTEYNMPFHEAAQPREA
ncbi:hypothetical protein [Leuconostoc pseudomesenteroides]|uniref:hypothetical protein n=1 Tax=Leuconostoc pseudomesenteroides TaxID=33968 RepID=UPI0032DF52E5